MKVILLQDVAKIGRRYEVVDVPDGYALNKLIPSRQAEPSTPQNLKRVKAMSDKQAAADAGVESAFETAVAGLKNKTIDVIAEANADGTMFQALKPEMIIEAVATSDNIELKRDWLQIATPIKSTGEHTILLSHGEVQGEFVINVVSK